MSVGFYVTLQRGKRTAWLLGPFAQHEDAIANIDVAVNKAYEIDKRTWFDPFGTSSITSAQQLPNGVLNQFFPKLFGDTGNG